jgi:phosphonate transport system permease protein
MSISARPELDQPLEPFVTRRPTPPSLPARPRSLRQRLLLLGWAGALIALLVYSWINVGGTVTGFFTGMFGSKGLFQDIVPESVPPDTSQVWPGVQAATTTLAVALLSIVFGMLGAIAMLPLSARNIAPARWLYELARLLQAVLRSIPELIMLLFFLIVFGFSPFAAVVALTFHGIGVKGKLYAEAVEEMDMAPVDALRAAGAGRLQVFLHAVLPGVRNTLTGLTLYRLDANFRSAVTLGAVGGGGIGFLIDNELNVFQFKPVTTYIIILIVFVLVIERVSSLLRARLA